MNGAAQFPATLRAVTFDLDGTLYHAKPVRRRFAFSNMRALRAMRVRQAVRAELRGQAFVTGEEFFVEETQRCAERLDLDLSSTRTLLDELFGPRLCRVLAKVGPRADARPTLEALLARGLAVGVVSDFAVDDKLDALGLADLPFAARIAADACGALKPHPRAFIAAANLMHCRPNEILHVGDREDTDVAGAIAAGQHAYWLTATTARPTLLSGTSLDAVVAGVKKALDG